MRVIYIRCVHVFIYIYWYSSICSTYVSLRAHTHEIHTACDAFDAFQWWRVRQERENCAWASIWANVQSVSTYTTLHCISERVSVIYTTTKKWKILLLIEIAIPHKSRRRRRGKNYNEIYILPTEITVRESV